MTRAQIHFCSVGSQRVAFAVQGSGPVLVLGPACVSDLERDTEEPRLRAFYERLAARFTLVRYDHTGVGSSDRGRDDFSFEREVAELSSVVDCVSRQQPVVLMGGSFGGPVATAFAARHPERLSQLVLYGTFGAGEQLAPAGAQRAITDMVRAHWRLGARMLTSIVAPGVSEEEASRYARTQVGAVSAETAANLLQMMYRMDVRHEAALLRTPTLVIHRRHDRSIPLEAARDVASRIPGSGMITLEGQVHLPWFESSGVLDAALEFLNVDDADERSRESGEHAELIRSGDVWAIGWAGSRQHLKHAKGLSDIATLVQSPGTGIAALTLAEGMTHAGLEVSAQPLLDDQARREFRQRLRDIDVELGEAEAHVDLARQEKLTVERQALLSELSAAAGLGMRKRVFASDAERARKAVTARLRDAIARVRSVHPTLGEHLDGSIVTGLTCMYRPARPIRWRTAG
ncbi:MAG: alpha/beta fold hydrolase [Myxococcales bacterium]|nr:MAG: alpha/beta fold hydrolase [Myxococcales bacterium]